nr:MAG TPA: hypothetical protein [Caudoviricetes sp.]
MASEPLWSFFAREGRGQLHGSRRAAARQGGLATWVR